MYALSFFWIALCLTQFTFCTIPSIGHRVTCRTKTWLIVITCITSDRNNGAVADIIPDLIAIIAIPSCGTIAKSFAVIFNNLVALCYGCAWFACLVSPRTIFCLNPDISIIWTRFYTAFVTFGQCAFAWAIVRGNTVCLFGCMLYAFWVILARFTLVNICCPAGCP